MVKHVPKSTIISLLLMIVLTGCTACAPPEEFEVSSLEVQPDVCLPGDTVTVAVDVKNVGGREGIYTAILKVNAVEVDTRDVVVAAGGTETVSFELTEDVPGTYTINLEGLTGALRVLKPAEFKVSNLSITPEEVKAGGEVTLEADIENIGEVEGTYPVTLKVDGVEVETKDIMVAAGDSETISFELTEDDPGMYTINLEELTGEVRFRELKPAEFELLGVIRITSNPVKVGEKTSIRITIRNVGEAEGTYTARLVVDGLEEQTSDVTLTGGVSESVAFSVSKDSVGSYSVEIGDRKAVLEVFEPVRLSTGTYIVREMYGKSKIEITENSLAKDAVIVLCSCEEPSIPLRAVYIQSGDTFIIRGIREGTHAIYITTGRDWNDDSKEFTAATTYGQFAHAIGPGELTTEWEFEQTDRRYRILLFPLKPFAGGVWGTQPVSKAVFPELE